jgi:hypothetical protein
MRRDEEIRRRRDALLREEAKNPAVWWWLSFADEHFLGAVVIRARGFVSAVELTRLLGINPGGEVKGAELPASIEPPPAIVGRLLSKKEIEEQLGGAAEWK